MNCVPGCICDTGYIRADKTGHSYGPCIQKQLCNGSDSVKPNQCGANEKYDKCSAHCQDVCGEEPGPCTKLCDGGCVCDTGYIRTRNRGNSLGPCIPKQQCHRGCTDHNNEKRYDGESWQCADGCNKCACILGIIDKITKMACGPCDQPFGVTGHCRAKFDMISYNKTTGECQKFVYGGCGGNANRFETMKECYHECIKKEPSTGCTDHNNEKRKDGESWLCEDGCNKCHCNKGTIEEYKSDACGTGAADCEAKCRRRNRCRSGACRRRRRACLKNCKDQSTGCTDHKNEKREDG